MSLGELVFFNNDSNNEKYPETLYEIFHWTISEYLIEPFDYDEIVEVPDCGDYDSVMFCTNPETVKFFKDSEEIKMTVEEALQEFWTD